MNDTRFSLAEIFQLRGRAFTKISDHAFAIDAIAAAVAELDFALQSSIAERNVDELQGLVTSVRLLSDAMDGGAA